MPPSARWSEYSGKGEKVTGRNLYRLRAGLGFAHMALGDVGAAINEFRNAQSADPNWPGSGAILAIAEYWKETRCEPMRAQRRSLPPIRLRITLLPSSSTRL